jgi:hypothetical protein
MSLILINRAFVGIVSVKLRFDPFLGLKIISVPRHLMARW